MPASQAFESEQPVYLPSSSHVLNLVSALWPVVVGNDDAVGIHGARQDATFRVGGVTDALRVVWPMGGFSWSLAAIGHLSLYLQFHVRTIHRT